MEYLCKSAWITNESVLIKTTKRKAQWINCKQSTALYNATVLNWVAVWWSIKKIVQFYTDITKVLTTLLTIWITKEEEHINCCQDNCIRFYLYFFLSGDFELKNDLFHSTWRKTEFESKIYLFGIGIILGWLFWV